MLDGAGSSLEKTLVAPGLFKCSPLPPIKAPRNAAIRELIPRVFGVDGSSSTAASSSGRQDMLRDLTRFTGDNQEDSFLGGDGISDAALVTTLVSGARLTGERLSLDASLRPNKTSSRRDTGDTAAASSSSSSLLRRGRDLLRARVFFSSGDRELRTDSSLVVVATDRELRTDASLSTVRLCVDRLRDDDGPNDLRRGFASPSSFSSDLPRDDGPNDLRRGFASPSSFSSDRPRDDGPNDFRRGFATSSDDFSSDRPRTDGPSDLRRGLASSVAAVFSVSLPRLDGPSDLRRGLAGSSPSLDAVDDGPLDRLRDDFSSRDDLDLLLELRELLAVFVDLLDLADAVDSPPTLERLRTDLPRVGDFGVDIADSSPILRPDRLRLDD